MLYDPKWEMPVKIEPSLAHFIAWLETKDPKAKYSFWECEGRCLLGQYMAEIGIPWTGAPDSAAGDWGKSSFARTARQIFGDGPNVRFNVLSQRPNTFGGALKRARALSIG